MALKLLARDDPESVQRMLREARLQSRIDHPNICKVYDTGTYRERPFIAMQLVDGVPFDQALEGRGRKDAVGLVAQVARALDAAHNAGLVHRDLKPGNILVETKDDGSLFPYLVDFGVAREQDAPGLTVTGQVIGTPGYMAPEQAQGAVCELDHRADIFGLGVILFQVLTGRLPFEGQNTAEVLVGLLQHETPPVRSIAGDTHPDLAAIVDTCLERAPQRRYRTAAALAEDLERYLENQPVSVRPLGPGRRLLRQARRKPWTTSAAVTGIVAALALGIFMLWTRIEAGREIRRVQELSRELEGQRARLRHHAMAPIHEAATFRRSVRRRTEELEREVRHLGRAARGPGHLALARSLLALGDPEAARVHLEAARKFGYRPPEARLALGRVHGELYQRRLDAASRIEEADLRAAALEQARRDHLGLALEHLEAARVGADSTTVLLVEALLALYEGRYGEAREAAHRVLRESPWLFEAGLVTARAHQAEAIEALRKGDLAAADERFDAALDAWERVREIAPSDPRAYWGEADLCAQRAAAAIARARQGWDVDVEAGLATLAAAERIDPRSPRTLALRSRLLRMKAWSQAERGTDPRAGLDLAIRSATRAVELDPKDPEGHQALGEALTRLGAWYELRGEDAVEVYEQAEAALLSALELRPGSYDSLVALGEMRLLLGKYAHRYREADPDPIFERALATFERAQRLDLGTAGDVGAGLVHFELAELAAFGSAEEQAAQDAGVEACTAAAQADPNDARAWLCLGRLHRRALETAHRGLEDTESLVSAVTQSLGRAIELRPDLAEAHYELGRALLAQAEHLTRLGQDSTVLVDRSTAAFEQASGTNPEHAWALGRIGRAVELGALLKRRRGEDPLPEYRRQVELQRRALDVNPRNRDAWMGLGEAHFQTALQIFRRTGTMPSAELDHAESAFREMVGLDPGIGWMKLGWVELARASGAFSTEVGDPDAHIERARTYQQRSSETGGSLYAWLLRGPIELQAARHRIRVGESPAAELDAAENALARARELGLGGHEAEALRVEGLVHYLRAVGGVGFARSHLEKAESVLVAALEIDGTSTGVRLDIARCRIERARTASSADVAADHRARAREALQDALALDPGSRSGRELLAELAQGTPRPPSRS